MQVLLDVSTLIAGYGLLVAIIYAAFQFREAKNSREATNLSSVVTFSPTEFQVTREGSLKSINEGKLNYNAFRELSDSWQQRILKPLNVFDMVGYLVAVKAIRLNTVVGYFGKDAVLTSWNEYEPLVLEMRQKIGQYAYTHFEYLADAIEESAARSRLKAVKSK